MKAIWSILVWTACICGYCCSSSYLDRQFFRFFRWVLLWLSRLNLVKNYFGQSSHLNFFWPKWISMCFMRLHSWVKLVWQFCWRHLYGLWLVWIIKWSKKLCHFLNTFEQFSCLQTINLSEPFLEHGLRYSIIKYSLLSGTIFFIPTSYNFIWSLLRTRMSSSSFSKLSFLQRNFLKSIL